MHWNHRVVRTVDPHRHEPTLFAVHEAYYGLTAPGDISITEHPTVPMGETLAELREDLTRMLAALEHPILDGDADPVVELAESTPPSRPALLERVRSAEGETTADRRDGARETYPGDECWKCNHTRRGHTVNPALTCGQFVEDPSVPPATPAASGALPPVPVGKDEARALIREYERAVIGCVLRRGDAESVGTLTAANGALLAALLSLYGATPEGGLRTGRFLYRQVDGAWHFIRPDDGADLGPVYDGDHQAALSALATAEAAIHRERQTSRAAVERTRSAWEAERAKFEAALAAERERAETAERNATQAADNFDMMVEAWGESKAAHEALERRMASQERQSMWDRPLDAVARRNEQEAQARTDADLAALKAMEPEIRAALASSRAGTTGGMTNG